MSEQEFELYLKLLSRCLNLTPGQREQIADELRDHLEERLEELAQAGVPREKAVIQALDEFGDAAVLAGNFASIARLKRRRFLMRLSLGSVGVLTAALLIAFAFWPENRAVRGPETAVAQEKPKQTIDRPTGAAAPSAGESHKETKANLEPEILTFGAIDPPATRADKAEHPVSSDVSQSSRIEAALESTIDFAIDRQPLRNVLELIAKKYNILIALDVKSLRKAQILPEALVDAVPPGVRLKTALGSILKIRDADPDSDQFNLLDYEVVDSVLLVSTNDAVSEHISLVVYDCRDLIRVTSLDPINVEKVYGPPPSAQAAVEPNPGNVPSAAAPAKTVTGRDSPATTGPGQGRLPLIDLLLTATYSITEGTNEWISEFGGMLVVRSTPAVHREIKSVLEKLRLMRKDGAFANADSNAKPGPQAGKPADHKSTPHADQR